MWKRVTGGVFWGRAGWVLCALVVVAGACLGPPAWWLRQGRICPNTHIETVDVGGLDQASALNRLEEGLLIPKLRLLSVQRSWYLSVQHCGGAPRFEEAVGEAFDVGRGGNPFAGAFNTWKTWYSGKYLSLPFEFDQTQLRKTLRPIAWSVNRPAQNASIQLVNGYVYAREGKWGYRFDPDITVARIVDKFGINASSVSAAITPMPPNATAADVRSINAVIAKYSTRLNPRLQNRTRNIRVACAEMNGRILAPGEVFSFNAMTGERTYAKGYRMAKIFDRREIVDGLAGGVCQVSTTLYNCARKLKLPIVERHHHSLPVPYIRGGLDATVSYPYRDLKFRNALPASVALWTELKGNQLTIYILGRGSTQPDLLASDGMSVAQAATLNQ